MAIVMFAANKIAVVDMADTATKAERRSEKMISAKALTELEAAVAVLNEHRYQDCGHWNIQGDGKVVVRSAVPRAISIAAVDAIAIAEGLNAKEQVVTLSRALQTAREA